MFSIYGTQAFAVQMALLALVLGGTVSLSYICIGVKRLFWGGL